jgi:hypothetical protein
MDKKSRNVEKIKRLLVGIAFSYPFPSWAIDENGDVSLGCKCPEEVEMPCVKEAMACGKCPHHITNKGEDSQEPGR